LQAGSNEITVTATAVSGAKAFCKLTVSFGGGRDTVAPAITITYPASAAVVTYSASISVRGTATDNAGVSAVTWSVQWEVGTRWEDSGLPKSAAGWYEHCRGEAFDAAGNSSGVDHGDAEVGSVVPRMAFLSGIPTKGGSTQSSRVS
jgi:hypothetical protein